jgi:ATP-binding cassette subfamily B multidrug efflux pump
VRNLSDQYNTLQSAMAGAERIFEVLDKDASLPQSSNPHRAAQIRGEISFENVWFSYDDPKEGTEPNWVLRDVSFTARPGQSVVLVGATGSGKSTIIQLLLRFYDIQKGRILVDGVDIREYAMEDLRRHIGLVLQDVFLFSGSVEDNISLDNPDIQTAQIQDVLSSIGAHSFVERLPNGLAQDVQERGLALSQGQRQLISFARALVYNPGILVLDEATSSIDTETERLIQNAMDRLLNGRTSLVVAHRLSTIQHAEQILVMHRGEIRERGNHQSLLRQDGLYKRLYELQFRHEESPPTP